MELVQFGVKNSKFYLLRKCIKKKQAKRNYKENKDIYFIYILIIKRKNNLLYFPKKKRFDFWLLYEKDKKSLKNLVA